MQSLILRLAGYCVESPGTLAPHGRNGKRSKDLRMPAESDPAENVPDSEAREPLDERADQWPGKTRLAPLPIPRFSEIAAQAANGKGRPCSAGRSGQKTGP